jgi:hypothetical protein
MSTERRTDSPETSATLERERMALSLLRRAGRRAAPPPEVNERMYAAVLGVWMEETRRRQQTKRRLAIAAGLAAVALGAGTWMWQRQAVAVNVANVTRFVSAVTVERAGVPQAVTGSFELKTGDRIDVPAGSALAAQRPDGMSVRVAGPAYLVWDAPDRIRLEHGRIYVDVGPAPDTDRAAFEVRTALALIEHVGTRFVAESSPTRVRVAVRDGSVRITSTNGAALGLGRGQAAEAAANGEIAWVTPPSRTDWAWVDALAPPCGIEGRSLFAVLRDLAREADLDLAFASPEVERRARGLTLHGPALDLPPRTAIDAVLATTDLDADLTGQRVVLRDRVTSSL